MERLKSPIDVVNGKTIKMSVREALAFVAPAKEYALAA
jgi:hypothetical protein